MTAYLNQNFYGNRSYGIRPRRQELLRDRRPVQADPGPGGDPGRHPPVADDLRPGQERRGDVLGHGRRGRRLPGRQDAARRARPTRRSSSGATTILDLMKTLAAVLTAGHVHRRPTTRRPRRSRSSSPRRPPPNWLAPAVRLAGPPPARRDPVRRRPGGHLRAGRHRRLQGHHDARLERSRRRPRSGSRRRRSPRTGGTPPAYLKTHQRVLRSLDPQPQGSRASTTPRSARSTTGPARSWPTSAAARYYEKPHGKKFQPQFDVLGDGWRQPGSAFKPINYLTGIEDHTLTAAHDVHGRRHELRRRLRAGRRRPPRARPAPPAPGDPAVAQHPGDQGRPDQRPGPRLRVRQADGHRLAVDQEPGRRLDRDRHRRAPLHRPDQRLRRDRQRRRPDAADDDPRGRRTATARRSGRRRHDAGRQAGDQPPGRLHHEGHPGQSNTDPRQNPFWSSGRSTTARPAPTGGAQDRYHERRDRPRGDGLRRAAQGPQRAGARRRRLDGQLGQQRPAERHGRPRDRGQPVAGVPRGRHAGHADRPVRRQAQGRRPRSSVDANSGMLPGPFTHRTVKEWFINGTVPKQVDNTKVGVAIDKATGQLWQDGCLGPKVTKGFLDLSERRRRAGRSGRSTTAAGSPGPRAASASAADPRGPRPTYFGFGGFFPFGATWGAPFAPIEEVPDRRPARRPRPAPEREPAPERRACPRPRADGASARPAGTFVAHRLTIVAPSPPSPRSPGRSSRTSGFAAALARTASRRAPGPETVDDRDPVQARPAPRRRGSARGARAPRRPGRRAGRATRRPSGPARARARPSPRPAPLGAADRALAPRSAPRSVRARHQGPLARPDRRQRLLARHGRLDPDRRLEVGRRRR